MVRAVCVDCARVRVCRVGFLRELVFRVEGAKERGSCGGMAGQILLRFHLPPMGCLLADPGFRVADFVADLDFRLVDHCFGFGEEVRRLG